MSPEPATVAGLPAVQLRDGLVLGRSSEADVLLAHPSVSRKHAVIRASDGGWAVEDGGSRSGSYLNGRLFGNEQLVVGDVLRIGPFALRFDGRSLVETAGVTGARLEAWHLKKAAGRVPILHDVSLRVEPCEFVGIIGASGAGKSTLLDALCLLRPADSGLVHLDGSDLKKHFGALRSELGYVPQDDIVPLELSVEEALFFSARLRLPAGTPVGEIRRLVSRTIVRLGLAERARTPVGRLSGGQRKRVSVGAELLGRPRLLFLDEPTSGLDPAAEFRLMESLRHLAAGGCTVLCTTHVMENAHLMDRLMVLDGGRLVYDGPPGEAPAAFGVSRLPEIFSRTEAMAPKVSSGDPPPAREPVLRPVRRSAALPILLFRQWAILRSDRRNLLLLAGQPIAIGAMVTWVTHDPALLLFFAMISTLWFGCGNAAQEIVREWPMYRRERLIGLGRSEYLLAKFLSLSRITVLQSLLLWFVLRLFGGGMDGASGWQIAGLVATAFASVGLGLVISAWTRSVLQAVMLVPLVLIPQILFSGFTPPAGDMEKGPYAVSRVMPSAACQAVMDVSLFWGRTVTGAMRVDYPTAFSNLNRERRLKNGMVFRRISPARNGLLVLGGWTAVTLALAWAGLRRRERSG